MQPGLIIVSNRLPISVKKVDGQLQYSRSIGGLATGLASYATDPNNKWIGWPGLASDGLTEKERQAIAEELAKSNCYPVFLTQKQLDGFYNGYANRIIWQLMHDIPLSDEALELENSYWKYYRQVNQLYAQSVLALSDPDNSIWVHDYLLMLLPELLRAERPEGRIGFFLHTPFPQPAALDTIKHGRELVQGLLGADLIGFQIQNYIEGFTKTIEHFKLGTIAGNTLTLPNHRAIRITDFPISIDYNQWRRAGRDPKVRDYLRDIRQKYGGKKMIISIDRMDPSKGIPRRIEAYGELLKRNPKLRGKVVMLVIGAPNREDVKEYQQLRAEVERLVQWVNKKYATAEWQPIEYRYAAAPFEEVAALFQHADIAYISPQRDGMNLMAKEYVASKQAGRKGVLVLSSSAGAAQELTEAVMIEANDIESHVSGLEQALNMSYLEALRRIRAMQRNISTSTIHTWAKRFLTDMQSYTGIRTLPTRALNAGRQQRLLSEYRQALRPLLLLDYDGMLARIRSRPQDAKPNEQLLELLQRLSAATTVVIISGRSKENMQDWFDDLPVALVAEHGNFTKSANAKKWTAAPSQATKNWQSIILPILEKYAAHTPGALVEIKQTSLAWHYREANPYYAQKYLVTLKQILGPLTRKHGLELQQGKKVLEIRPTGINKGTAAQAWVKRVKPDFILAAGDDETDEDMFKALPQTSYTIKVGRGRTSAQYRLKNVAAVHDLLRQMTRS